jgi:hypothetical protein
MVGVQKTLLDFSLNRNPTINYGQGNEAEELTLLAIRERGGGEQQLVHHRSRDRDAKSREE